MDYDHLSILDSWLGLHQRIEVIYVVDNYCATIEDEEKGRLEEAYGETVAEALASLGLKLKGQSGACF